MNNRAMRIHGWVKEIVKFVTEDKMQEPSEVTDKAGVRYFPGDKYNEEHLLKLAANIKAAVRNIGGQEIDDEVALAILKASQTNTKTLQILQDDNKYLRNYERDVAPHLVAAQTVSV